MSETPTPEPVPEVKAADLGAALNFWLQARRELPEDCDAGVAQTRAKIADRWPEQEYRSALFKRLVVALRWIERQGPLERHADAQRRAEAVCIAAAVAPLADGSMTFGPKFHVGVAAATKQIAATAASFN